MSDGITVSIRPEPYFDDILYLYLLWGEKGYSKHPELLKDCDYIQKLQAYAFLGWWIFYYFRTSYS